MCGGLGSIGRTLGFCDSEMHKIYLQKAFDSIIVHEGSLKVRRPRRWAQLQKEAQAKRAVSTMLRGDLGLFLQLGPTRTMYL